MLEVPIRKAVFTSIFLVLFPMYRRGEAGEVFGIIVLPIPIQMVDVVSLWNGSVVVFPNILMEKPVAPRTGEILPKMPVARVRVAAIASSTKDDKLRRDLWVDFEGHSKSSFGGASFTVSDMVTVSRRFHPEMVATRWFAVPCKVLPPAVSLIRGCMPVN
jgi:hypothetical protein